LTDLQGLRAGEEEVLYIPGVEPAVNPDVLDMGLVSEEDIAIFFL
jgi:hypothetical protein